MINKFPLSESQAETDNKNLLDFQFINLFLRK